MQCCTSDCDCDEEEEPLEPEFIEDVQEIEEVIEEIDEVVEEIVPEVVEPTEPEPEEPEEEEVEETQNPNINLNSSNTVVEVEAAVEEEKEAVVKTICALPWDLPAATVEETVSAVLD